MASMKHFSFQLITIRPWRLTGLRMTFCSNISKQPYLRLRNHYRDLYYYQAS